MIVGVSSGFANVWTQSQFKSKFGRAFDPAKDCVAFMNADTTGVNSAINCPSYMPSTQIIGVGFESALSGTARINYIVVLAA